MTNTTAEPRDAAVAIPNMREAAAELRAAGLNVVPIKQDGTKMPDLPRWRQYQTERTTPQQHDKWFDPNRYEGARTGVGYICGAISGNVATVEFEGRAVAEGLLDEAADLMDAHGLAELWEHITTGYTRNSPSGGVHIDVRVTDGVLPGGTKIAQRAAREDEYTADERQRLRKNPKAKVIRCLVETRGEGNLVVVDPSHGTVHQTGRSYQRRTGSPATIAGVTADEYEAVTEILGLLDQTPRQESVAPGRRPAPLSNGRLRPGDDFNERGDWVKILEGIFRPILTRGGTTYWGWADGHKGVKATTGRNEKDQLYVFTTSSEFDSEKAYNKFAAYTLLHHNSDWAAAAKDLAGQGYGTQEPPRPSVVPSPRPQPTEPAPAPPQVEPPSPSPRSFGDFRIPNNYDLAASGVHVKRTVNKEDVWFKFTTAPLVVTASFVDPDGEQSVELTWMDRGKVVSKIVPRSIAKRGKELVKHLGSYNLPIVESNARLTEQWLAEFEAANEGLIPHGNVARWLGWQPGKNWEFLSSADGDTRLEVAHVEQRAPLQAFHPSGTLSGWKDTIKALEGLQVPRVALAAGFASTLLAPLCIHSFTLDMSSRSTKGKTTCVQCALSIWADPSEQAGGMASWRISLYAIEKRLNLVRGIITPLDETMAADDPELIDKVLYQLPMGQGKGRGGGEYAKTLTWETIVLSTGERPALSYTTSQGAAARVLSTTQPPFGHNGGEVAAQARAGVLENFGQAGPAFVAQLQAGLRSDGGQDRLRDRHRALTARFKGDNDMTGRRAPMVAALALAERLASEWKILPYEPLTDDTWTSLFTVSSPTDNRPEMALDIVRGYVASHGAELYGSASAGDRQPYSGWLGVITRDKDGTSKVALIPERVRRILGDAGYQLDAVVGGWVEAGYLTLSKSQRPAHLVPRRMAGGRAKCLEFSSSAINFGQEQEDEW